MPSPSLLVVFGLAFFAHPPLTWAAPLTSGNLIVLRVNSSAALGTTSVPVFIDEIAAGTGAVLQTIPIPATGTSACTLSGTIVGEGQLTISSDGTLASFACYAAASGTGTISTTSPATYPRAIVNVFPSGAVSPRVGLGTSAYSGRAVYGAVAFEPTFHWYSFGPSGGSRGLSYNTANGLT